MVFNRKRSAAWQTFGQESAGEFESFAAG